MRGAVLHDPLALALSIDPNLAEIEERYVYVDTSAGSERGRIVASNSGEHGHRVGIATNPKRDQFIRLVTDRLAMAATTGRYLKP